ncbi:Flp pilus assembly protein CpaB [Amphiplicatus metriothermophilus]|uniref:Pilus assembly protein CpaB n=1 Tax=Amphiplicatus metriothermophilus TaxID=1519374 RepID=A0A239PJ66_9PROT|nr:Flp pilus assembly protein CpaB [Amphiplicatus metriothermophilus]MBB5518001.1 pilus assembly protein CpaB [Amphiplicatus metriothermophilus]SNT67665.1 pilus assembly protein CpaB [Amphiplicatus metriothermophilus]
MNVSRMAVLAVALVAGVGAFFLMMNNSPAPQTVQIIEPAKEETVRVLVADKDFQRGERLGVETVKWVAWPKKALSPSFITEAGGVKTEDLAGAVARTLIVAGEPIIEQKIVRAGNSGLMAAILTPGMRAVTLRVSPETASGGFILPGDRVDVLHTTGGRDGGAPRTRTIFENVRVLAVNAMYAEAPEAAHIEGATVTLEFSPGDAESFISARANGTLSLALRSVFQPEGEVESQTRRSSDVTVIRYGRS